MHVEPDNLRDENTAHSGLFTKIITVQFCAVIVLLILLAFVRLLSYGTYEKIAASYKSSFFTTYDFTEKCEDVFKSINDFFQKDDIEVSNSSILEEASEQFTTDENEPVTSEAFTASSEAFA